MGFRRVGVAAGRRLRPSRLLFLGQVLCARCHDAPAARRSLASKEHSGGDSAGAPPLPIPNREVKPGCADGTAQQCGRVGSRRYREVKPGCADGTAQQCGRVGSRRFLFMWVPRRPGGLSGNLFFVPRRSGNDAGADICLLFYIINLRSFVLGFDVDDLSAVLCVHTCYKVEVQL